MNAFGSFNTSSGLVLNKFKSGGNVNNLLGLIKVWKSFDRSSISWNFVFIWRAKCDRWNYKRNYPNLFTLLIGNYFLYRKDTYQ
jgi:hypothetical protein